MAGSVARASASRLPNGCVGSWFLVVPFRAFRLDAGVPFGQSPFALADLHDIPVRLFVFSVQRRRNRILKLLELWVMPPLSSASTISLVVRFVFIIPNTSLRASGMDIAKKVSEARSEPALDSTRVGPSVIVAVTPSQRFIFSMAASSATRFSSMSARTAFVIQYLPVSYC